MNYLKFDIECYINYFLVCFKSNTGRKVAFELYEDHPLDRAGLQRVLDSGLECVSFNGINYDHPMLRLAMTGASCADLKALSDDIVQNELKPWDAERKYNLPPLPFNHIDLKEVAPGMAGLKIYGGRLHCKRMQDLPYEPDSFIWPGDREIIRDYCFNDLDTTGDLREALEEQIALRRAMMDEMRQALEEAGLDHIFPPIDLRSKSDAQIAEAVIKQNVFLRTGAIPRKTVPSTKGFFYKAPDYIQFRTEVLQNVLHVVQNSPMLMKESGHVAMPAAIKKLVIEVGDNSYKMGLGGLHSREQYVSHYADENHLLRDIDVVSYYPYLMLNMGMYPEATGPHFLPVFREIVETRVAAKRAGNKVKADSLKITVNGTFGKTSSKYSILYNPRMMIQTTITGQLSILMLIEWFTMAGIPVVSANTDGIVIRCPRDKEALQRKLVNLWERVTRLETEETNYASLHSRDVNSYVAIKLDGKIKTKGAFARAGLMKNPTNEVCLDAVEAYLTKGIAPEVTVAECQDIRKFLTVRRVAGGAVKDDEFYGRAVRWYYSTQTRGVVRDRETGNAVARTKGAQLLMELCDGIPDDLDREWYVKETYDLLADLAVIKRPPKPKLPRRGTKAWKALEAEGLVETDEFDKPCWTCRYEEIPEQYRIVN